MEKYYGYIFHQINVDTLKMLCLEKWDWCCWWAICENKGHRLSNFIQKMWMWDSMWRT